MKMSYSQMVTLFFCNLLALSFGDYTSENKIKVYIPPQPLTSDITTTTQTPTSPSTTTIPPTTTTTPPTTITTPPTPTIPPTTTTTPPSTTTNPPTTITTPPTTTIPPTTTTTPPTTTTTPPTTTTTPPTTITTPPTTTIPPTTTTIPPTTITTPPTTTIPPTTTTIPPSTTTIPPTTTTTPPTTITTPPTTTIPPTTTTTPPTTITTPPTTTIPPTTPTTPPSTTTNPPTNTTTPPTTTTTIPPTTTPIPPTNTTTPPPTTPLPTTPPPTTQPPTTTTAPVTTPKPSPKPEPGTWVVQNHTTNVTCIIVEMAMQVNVSYAISANETKHLLIDGPKTVGNVTGNCGAEKQIISLWWVTETNQTNKFALEFHKNDTTKQFWLAQINILIMLDPKVYPDVQNLTELHLVSSSPEFNTPVSMSYRCMKKQLLNLTMVQGNTTVATLEISNTQIEAFRDKTDTVFGVDHDCLHPRGPSVALVPIAGSCVLVIFLLAILLVTIIRRRQSQAHGYLGISREDSLGGSIADMIPLQDIPGWKRCWRS